VAALLVSGCAYRDDEPSAPRELTVARGAVSARYVAGDRLGSTRLAAPVVTSLIANLAPAAVPDATGERVAYNSWRGDRPVVRVRDGSDVVLAEGAYSPAWRRDGAIAYFQALRQDLPSLAEIRRYRGHIVVRGEVEEKPARWTRQPARYAVAAWAGDHLLAYRITSGWPELLVLDGSGRQRLLARAAALVAISPDARNIFVSTYGASPPLVRVLDIGTGAERARLRVPGVRWIVEAGSWRGGRVAASASSGIAVFGVTGAKITLQQLLRLDRKGFPTGVFEPQLDEAGGRVTAWGERESRPRQAFPGVAVVQCDLAERRCVRGRELSSAVGLRLVYDPSRP
jgi:hypothetical protein